MAKSPFDERRVLHRPQTLIIALHVGLSIYTSALKHNMHVQYRVVWRTIDLL